MNVIFSEKAEKRMDRFDAVVHEYLRANKKSIEYVAEKVGCNPSSLWRYRNRVEAFQKMPFEILCGCLRLAHVTNEDLRYICGL